MYHIWSSLSVEAQQILNERNSALEIKEVIFQMELSKAPGPDGFTALFYQKFWNTVGTTITQHILQMLNNRKLEDDINDTLITCTDYQNINNYRTRWFQTNIFM